MLLKFALLAASATALTIDQSAPITSMSTQLPAFSTGFSIEWDEIRRTFLQDSAAVYAPDHPIDGSLLNQDTVKSAGNYENTTLLLRIGGNSSIAVWINGTNIPRLTTQTVVVTSFDLRIIDLVANITNAKLILNMGMPTAIPTYVGSVIDSWQTYITPQNIQAIEIGHEMDNAASRGFRPVGYTTSQYLIEFLAYQVSLQRRYPSIANMGPSLGYRWRSEYQVPFMKRFMDKSLEKAVEFTRGFISSLEYFSFHRYGIKGCSVNTTLDSLLNREHSYDFVSNYTLLLNGSNSKNVWSEGASVSCGGKTGVSDVFGSALWTLDSLLDMSYRGVEFSIMSGVPNKLYAPFVVGVDGKVFARPSYYGMLAFSAIISGSNSSVYQASVNKFGTNTRLKAWGVLNHATQTHTFVIIHKDIGAPFDITIKAPGSTDGTTAQVVELTSAKLNDLTGFTLGGLTFPGIVAANYKEATVAAQGGTFKITANTGTATIVKIATGVNAEPILSFI